MNPSTAALERWAVTVQCLETNPGSTATGTDKSSSLVSVREEERGEEERRRGREVGLTRQHEGGGTEAEIITSDDSGRQ